MRFFRRLSDRKIDSIFAGKVTVADGELQALAAFFHDAKIEFSEAPAAATEAAHMTRIFAAARESAVSVLEPRRTGSAPERRRNPFSAPAARTAIAAVGLAALAAFAGTAYAGVLPGPIQNNVSEIVRHVGISLPHSNNDAGHRGGNQGGGNQGGGTQPAQNNQPGRSEQPNQNQNTQTDTNGAQGDSQGSQGTRNGGRQGGTSQGDQTTTTSGSGTNQGGQGPQGRTQQDTTSGGGDSSNNRSRDNGDSQGNSGSQDIQAP